MHRPHTFTFSGILATLGLFLLFHVQGASAALSLTYCSSQNTGSGNEARLWTWQSNGWCFDECKDNYALAVVQDKSCWCSNYVPADQADTGDCDLDCPGFPDEKCGSKDKKLFGYIALQKKPSGTRGASKPTSAQVSQTSTVPTSSTVPSSSEITPTEATTPSVAPSSPVTSEVTHRDPETVVQTVTASASVVTLTPDGPSSSITTTSKSSHSSESSTGPVRIITVTGPSGQNITQTILYSPGASAISPPDEKKKSNPGAIAGGVVGGLVFLAAIVGAVIFLLRRRRQQGAVEDGQSGVQRNTSTMSKAGLLRTEKSPSLPPKIATNGNRNSRMQDSGSPSPIAGSERRSSRPYILDQRLNPSAIMNFENVSRASFVSLDDSRDYGRTLNVRNPDPDTDTK